MGHSNVQLVTLAVVSDTFFFGELGGCTLQGRVTTGFHTGSNLLHTAFHFQTLNAYVSLDLSTNATAAVFFTDGAGVEDIGKCQSRLTIGTVNVIRDFFVGSVTQ